MATQNTSELPGSSLIGILDKIFGLSGPTLERIGAFIVMWATFENDLERALWRLTNEVPEGAIPSTDTKPVSFLIKQFRETGLELEGEEWHGVVNLLCDIACYLAEYRNAIAHGQLLPACIGGGSVLNAMWHGEKRTRPPITAHIGERLVGIMLDALHELLIVIRAVISGETAPNLDSRVLGWKQMLQRARNDAAEIRYLTEAVNSEKY